MATPEKNDRLAQTGRGTPCGELMRRYWQPAALSEELANDKPLPVTLFGEELILFRDDRGGPALIGRYCAHQGVDMIYARVESDGIRCLYHGWLFDACGKVVVRGDWLPGGEQRMSVGQPAYPCAEIGGIIFTCMAPGEPPVLPANEFINSATPDGLTKVLVAKNYLQEILRDDESTHNGSMFVVPNLVVSQGSPSSADGWVRWHVPFDDDSHIEFTVRHVGRSSLTGVPVDSASQILLKALE